MFFYAEVSLNGDPTTVKRIPKPQNKMDSVERDQYIRKYLMDLGYFHVQICCIG